MPKIPYTNLVRTVARQSAGVMRAGASLLDLVGGQEDSDEQRQPQPQQQEQPQREQAPERPEAVAEDAGAARTAGAAGEAKSTKRARPRTERQRATAPKDLDDVTIARKVETELFRDRSVPKGHISVNVADGIVYLRGEVKHPDDVNRLEEQAAAIPEVVRVENLLHTPGTPAPTRADTPERQQKPLGRRTRPHSPEIHITETVNAEVPVPGAEPGPDQLARRHEGRQPAPLGSHGPSGHEGDDEQPEASSPSQRSVDSVDKDPEPAERA